MGSRKARCPSCRKMRRYNNLRTDRVRSPPKCSWCYGQNEAVFAAVAVVLNGPLVLAVSRKDNHADLGFPGGKLDRGESSLIAALRELKEETSLVVVAADSIYIGPDDHGHLCEAWLVYAHSGTPESREGALTKWAHREELLSPEASFRAYNKLLFEALDRAKAK